jgi:hypothetical protein
MGGLSNFSPDWPRTAILLISADTPLPGSWDSGLKLLYPATQDFFVSYDVSEIEAVIWTNKLLAELFHMFHVCSDWAWVGSSMW